MNKCESHLRLALCVLVLTAAGAISLQAQGANLAPDVQMDLSKAGPRAVETLTESRILRDYKFAWANFDQALESNSVALLNASFTGPASDELFARIAGQRSAGMTSRYLDQHHKVQAVFYAPEGDMIELQDAAEYQFQVLDGDKTIHDQHVVTHYVVLMTPGADHWMIRQMQEVPGF